MGRRKKKSNPILQPNRPYRELKQPKTFGSVKTARLKQGCFETPIENIRALWHGVMNAFVERMKELTDCYESATTKLYKSKFSYEARLERRWLYSENTSPGSFLWICGVLELDPNITRTNIVSLFYLLQD